MNLKAYELALEDRELIHNRKLLFDLAVAETKRSYNYKRGKSRGDENSGKRTSRMQQREREKVIADKEDKVKEIDKKFSRNNRYKLYPLT